MILVLIVVVSNLPPFSYLFNLVDNNDCAYANRTGTFTFQEMNFKNRDYTMAKWKFEAYKKENKKDTVLYRLCTINYFKFWNYRHYLTHEKYKLPYRPWMEIEKNRGVVENKSGYQDF